MNCNQDDMAIFVCNLFADNVGRMCKVLRRNYECPEDGPVWLVEAMQPMRALSDVGLGVMRPAGTRLLALDADLRPLRDGPGEDETLQWCPPPIKELA